MGDHLLRSFPSGARRRDASNTGSLFQVFSTLEKYGVRQYFDEITLSSIVGYRKPHPNIFRIACAQANLDPSECAFVGDTLSRDVVGPRRMGFGRVFKINSFLTKQKDIGQFDVAPDYQVTDIPTSTTYTPS